MRNSGFSVPTYRAEPFLWTTKPHISATLLSSSDLSNELQNMLYYSTSELVVLCLLVIVTRAIFSQYVLQRRLMLAVGFFTTVLYGRNKLN